MFSVPVVSHLSNDELVGRLRSLTSRSHEITAEILVHLAEVESRQLYLEAACGSMYVYVTGVLGFCEAAALKRIHAARTAKKFPRILEVLAAGQIHLTGIELLGPHLTEENQQELLTATSGKSKREIEGILAARAPKPDVPASIRKLPTGQGTRPGASTTTQAELGIGTTAGDAPSATPVTTREASPVEHRERPAARSSTVPLSENTHKVTFTASAATADKLAQAKALLGHREPGCDLGRVLELAVETLHAQLLKERFGVGAKPRRPSDTSDRTRHVPKALRREVVARDGLSCAFVDPKTGRRCGSRDRLELQHHQPFARGGAHSPENISLFCKAHNAHAARLDFGSDHIEAAIRSRRSDRTASGAAPGSASGGRDE
jgi:hypothetical protein